jgi:hypothetical protein
MHSCRYHPFKNCWMVGECVTCGAADLGVNENFCIRLDTLPSVRAIVSGLARELSLAFSSQHKLGGGSQHGVRSAGSGGGGGSKGNSADGRRECADSALQTIHREIVPAISTLFTGPVHLQAKASGLIACSVHEALSRRCGANACGQSHSNARRRNASQPWARHRAFCEPLRRGLGGMVLGDSQFSDPQYWDAVQGVLHPRRGDHPYPLLAPDGDAAAWRARDEA